MAQGGRETCLETCADEWDWEYLCAGGFGPVYKIRYTDGSAVAIELLDGDDGSDTLYAALCQVAEYMKAADHQYVPEVYGTGTLCPPNMGSTKRHGICMELMEGGSLQSFLETLSEPPPWPLAFRLAHQVALAMEYLHTKNDLVHIDLKPANILLDANFNAKIVFGLSTVSNSVRSTDGENKGGTLSYTPPEAFGDGYRPVRSYDVYSYGILLWTILTGESPYQGVDKSLLTSRIQKGDRPDLHKVDVQKAAGVEDLVDLMKRCWDPEPNMMPSFGGVDKSLLTFKIQKGDRPDLHKIDVQKAAGFEDLVDLMKRCWDPEPNKRPSFGECVEVTSRVLYRHEEGFITAADDILTQLTQDIKTKEKDLDGTKKVLKILNAILYPQAGPVPPGSLNRDDFLKHASPLSLDENTAKFGISLSEDNRKVNLRAPLGQKDRPYHPERFFFPNVLSRESLSERSYFEVEWRGESAIVAVSYKDIDRKDQFGLNDKSWGLAFLEESYCFLHNGIPTAVTGPFPTTGDRVGVYVDHSAGILSFYRVDRNKMRLLHTERTTFTQPLYAGIFVTFSAELCKIW